MANPSIKFAEIESHDFDRLEKMKNVDKIHVDVTFKQKLINSNIGWSSEFADKVILEYKKFMYLRIKYGEAAPSHLVDIVWHQHILYTKEYHSFCKIHNGSFINHDPDTFKGKSNTLYIRTLERLWKEFPGYDITKYWEGADRFKLVDVDKYHIFSNKLSKFQIIKLLIFNY